MHGMVWRAIEARRQEAPDTGVDDLLDHMLNAQDPEPTKANVAQAANIEEMEDRFGEMVMADQAALKQQITAECGDIVMEQADGT